MLLAHCKCFQLVGNVLILAGRGPGGLASLLKSSSAKRLVGAIQSGLKESFGNEMSIERSTFLIFLFLHFLRVKLSPSVVPAALQVVLLGDIF